MINASLTDQPIDLAKLLTTTSNPSHGAQIVFTGVVRNHNQGQSVSAVSYDAHKILAPSTFEQIAQEALSKFGPSLDLTIIHRFGRLAVGEISLVILVSSKHRDESFLASRYLIEEIKRRAPIWKKEHYLDGDSEWLQGHALCGHRSVLKEV